MMSDSESASPSPPSTLPLRPPNPPPPPRHLSSALASPVTAAPTITTTSTSTTAFSSSFVGTVVTIVPTTHDNLPPHNHNHISMSDRIDAWLLQQFGTRIDHGLSSTQVRERQQMPMHMPMQQQQPRRNSSTGTRGNHVHPPVHCPAWICCLLPCLKYVPSRQAFAAIQPDDALVKRQLPTPRGRGGEKQSKSSTMKSRWMRYDATALLQGDIIQLEAGDRVPADCQVVRLLPYYATAVTTPPHHDSLLLLSSSIDPNPNSCNRDNHHHDDEETRTARSSLLLSQSPIPPLSLSSLTLRVDHKFIISSGNHKNQNQVEHECQDEIRSRIEEEREREEVEEEEALVSFSSLSLPQLFWGGLVLQGRAICVVTAIGSATRVAMLIRRHQFPHVPNNPYPFQHNTYLIGLGQKNNHQQHDNQNKDNHDECMTALIRPNNHNNNDNDDGEVGISLRTHASAAATVMT